MSDEISSREVPAWLARLEHEWRDYRRGLHVAGPPEQAAFGAMWAHVRASAADVPRGATMSEAFFLMLLGQERELDEFRRALKLPVGG